MLSGGHTTDRRYIYTETVLGSHQSRPMKSWTPEQVIIAFKAAGLEAENSKKMTKEDYGLAPLRGPRLAFPDSFALCRLWWACVLAVESEDDMTQLKAYYDELGKASAAFFSWTFRHGNVLVQLNGDLPGAACQGS